MVACMDGSVSVKCTSLVPRLLSLSMRLKCTAKSSILQHHKNLLLLYIQYTVCHVKNPHYRILVSVMSINVITLFTSVFVRPQASHKLLIN